MATKLSEPHPAFDDGTGEAPKVHHMMLTLSYTGATGPNGEQPVEQVDAEISEYLRNGYHLQSTHYAGDTPGGIRLLYVLVQNGTA